MQKLIAAIVSSLALIACDEGIAVQKRGLMQRVLGDKKVPVARSVRCTALLARGYVGIAAEGDAAWGTVPA